MVFAVGIFAEGANRAGRVTEDPGIRRFSTDAKGDNGRYEIFIRRGKENARC